MRRVWARHRRNARGRTPAAVTAIDREATFGNAIGPQLPLAVVTIDGVLLDTSRAIFWGGESALHGGYRRFYYTTPAEPDSEDGVPTDRPFTVEQEPGRLVVTLTTEEDLAAFNERLGKCMGADAREELAAFFAERCELAPDAREAPQALYDAWLDWKEARPRQWWEGRDVSGLTREPASFARMMQARGFVQGRSHGKRFWKGIRLR